MHSETDPVIETPEQLRARVSELEALCTEVYVAAVELGLPQPLLNRLWTVAARGLAPHAFVLDMPPRQPQVPGSVAGESAPGTGPVGTSSAVCPLPDIQIIDRPLSGRDSETRERVPELKALPVRKTVCVVDDDPMMLEVLVRILRRENYDLISAGSGAEALEQVAGSDGPIDLLVTDFAMPGMKGHDLADRLRDRFPEIRVLYQTGFSDMLFEDRMELEDGAAFLEKPFTARGLREAARMVLFGQINP